MDSIQLVLLESPLLLLAGMVLLEAVLATCWWFRPGRVTSWLVVGGLLLSTVLLIVQHLVVTDREQIEQILETLALAVDCEDVETIASALDEDYQADGMGKRRFIERVESTFRRADIDEVKILNARIAVESDRATVKLRAHCRVKAPDWPYEYHLSSWVICFTGLSGDWLIDEVRHTEERGVSARELLNLLAQ